MTEIRPSPHIGRSARGVFARRAFHPGDVIEIAPVILIPNTQRTLIRQTVLENYVFDWGGGSTAVALGYGSLYNHAYDPNAHYYQDIDRKTLEFSAIRGIAEGDEITVNYNGSSESSLPMWFDVKDRD